MISHVLLFLTYRCNLHCGFCLSFNRYWHPDPSLSLPAAFDPGAFLRTGRGLCEMSTAQVIERVIPQCEKSGVGVIALSGGEVLIRKDAAEIFRALGASSLRWCVDSNLMLCDQQTAQAIIDSRCATVFVSLDGRRDVHNRLRGNPKAFDMAINGVRRLVAARRNSSRRPATGITVNFVLQPGNEREPPDMIELALECGAQALNFQLLSARDYTTRFEAAAAASSIQKALALARRSGLNVSVYPLPLHCLDQLRLKTWYSSPLHNDFYKSCAYIHSNLRIDPAGNILPCMEYKLGNILEQELLEIRSGPAYRAFRSRLTNHGPFPACLRCCNMTAQPGELLTS